MRLAPALGKPDLARSAALWHNSANDSSWENAMTIAKVIGAREREIFMSDLVSLGLGHAAHFGAEADIVEHGLPRKQRE